MCLTKPSGIFNWIYLNLFDFTDDSCFKNPTPLTNLNTPSGGWINVFLDLQFDCAVCVKGWKFYASRVGGFFATVWRPSNDEYKLELIGKNLITAESIGEQV